LWGELQISPESAIRHTQAIRSAEQRKPLTGIEGYPQAIKSANESGRIKY